MSLAVSSQVHATSPAPIHITIHENSSQAIDQAQQVDYSARAQWLRASVLGANDGLVSVASLMIGVGAVNQTSKIILMSGLAGLVAGACSMAIGEFVSVYAQYDIEVAQIKEDENSQAARLPSPLRAAGASALAFSVGALLPLMAGGFVSSWAGRSAAVCAVTSVSLVGFGAAAAALGGASMWKSGVRVLLGGWVAMGVSYGVLRVFGLVV